MGTGETLTHNPTITRRADQGETATTAPTVAYMKISTIERHMTPLYQATHYGVTLPEPMGTVTIAMRKVSLETKRKSSR